MAVNRSSGADSEPTSSVASGLVTMSPAFAPELVHFLPSLVHFSNSTSCSSVDAPVTLPVPLLFEQTTLPPRSGVDSVAVPLFDFIVTPTAEARSYLPPVSTLLALVQPLAVYLPVYVLPSFAALTQVKYVGAA